VLWDTVTKGARYLEELERVDQTRDLLFLHWLAAKQKKEELLGYPFPTSSRASIANLDLCREMAKATWPSQSALEKVAYVSGPSDPGYKELEVLFRAKGAPLERLSVPDRDEDRTITGNDVSLPSEALEAIVRSVEVRSSR
jgi:hypothetical protein